MAKDRPDPGLELFRRERYFDAHEAWEERWHKARGRAKLLLQGLIQGAVAMHHHRRGNKNGADYLFGKAAAKLARFKEESPAAAEVLRTIRREIPR